MSLICGTNGCGGTIGPGKIVQRPAWMNGWAVPAAILVLLPKCPLCIVAYAAVVGVGLSVSTAESIRFSLLAVAAVAIAFLLVRLLRRLTAAFRPTRKQIPRFLP